MNEPVATARDAAPPRPLWHVLLVRPEMMTLILLLIGIFAGSQLSEFFLDVNYILKSFTLSAEFAMVALVLTLVIIAGEIDLSFGAVVALSAIVAAIVMREFGWPLGVIAGMATRRAATGRAAPWGQSGVRAAVSFGRSCANSRGSRSGSAGAR